MITNRVVQAVKEGRPAFGVYVFSGSPRIVELLGFAGLDYVRIDMEASNPNPEAVYTMIQTAHAVGVTPFVRVPESLGESIDANLIQRVIDMGALGIIVPKIGTRAQVEEAVQVVKGPPVGNRNVGTMTFAAGYGRDKAADHLRWANENVLLSIQVETTQGIDSIEELAAIEGVDIVQSGRGDLAHAYGVPGRQYDPIVLEAEDKLVTAGLNAGKLTSVHYFPVKDTSHTDRLRHFMDRGVQLINLGIDLDVIEVYRRLLSDLRRPG